MGIESSVRQTSLRHDACQPGRGNSVTAKLTCRHLQDAVACRVFTPLFISHDFVSPQSSPLYLMSVIQNYDRTMRYGTMKEEHSPVAIVTGATSGIGLATAVLLKK